MKAWTENSEPTKASTVSSLVAGVLVVGAVAACGYAAGPASTAPTYHTACVSIVTYYQYAPELCDGSKAEQQWLTWGFTTYGTAKANGNALDAIVTATMANQGLTINGIPFAQATSY